MKLPLLYLSLLCCTINQTVLANFNEPIKPIPQTVELNDSLFNIGALLFRDKRLSKNNNVSCISCHVESEGFTQNTKFSTTSLGELRKRNTQSLFNSSLFSYLHWDGKFKSLKELSLRGMKAATSDSWDNILKFLKNDINYSKLFTQNFKDGVTKLNVASALAEYQKSYLTPDSPFDRYLRGDQSALTPQQQQGYLLFKNYGCVSCHNSMTIGGQMFAKLGQFGDYFSDRGSITKTDYGRYRITKLESDRFKFRVPSLRNIALTAPYFHDASQKTLTDAVQTMAKYQLGLSIPEQDIQAIVSFLKSLTGTFKGKPL